MGVKVVGVGPAEGFLTDRAKDIISRAEVVFGSRRALKLAEQYIRGERVEMTRFDEEEIKRIEKTGAEREVAVLSTGDPMVSGLGRLVKGKVEPGISSVQLALARLRIDLCDTIIVDAHARDSYQEILRASRFRNKILILADRKFNLSKLVKLGRSEGIGIAKLAVLTNLGMEDEEIVELSLSGDVPEQIHLKSDLTIVYIECSMTGGKYSLESDSVSSLT